MPRKSVTSREEDCREAAARSMSWHRKASRWPQTVGVIGLASPVRRVWPTKAGTSGAANNAGIEPTQTSVSCARAAAGPQCLSPWPEFRWEGDRRAPQQASEDYVVSTAFRLLKRKHVGDQFKASDGHHSD